MRGIPAVAWRRGCRATIELAVDRPSTCPLVGTGEKGCRLAELLAQADAIMFSDKRDGRADQGGACGSEGGGT